MKVTLKAGIASAALASVALIAGTAAAADLGGNRGGNAGGSIKDGGYVQPMPEIVRGSSGPCYFRADVGYSWSRDPEITWPVNSDSIVLQDDGYGNLKEVSRTSNFVTNQVSNTSRENGAFGEVGFGCGMQLGGGSGRGLRGELMFGVRGDRDVQGEPGNYSIDYTVLAPPPPVVPHGVPTPPVDVPVVEDPLHTSIKSYTMMFNAYKDLGTYGNITPYVGAGIGAAYHQVKETYFTGNYNLVNKIEGHNDLSFAWSLMAGVGYQISDRAVIDLGYRYIDMGDASSGRVDNAGFVNPRVDFDDLTAHEIKIGLRYSFGQSDCCAQQYVPMK
jgi:opacity protein-like surface antigen